tara:strand:+ start:164 stop:406 length:243 start_codon:yes stop_codon:yes gene_type:complete
MSSYDKYAATQLRAIADLIDCAADGSTYEIKEAACISLADILRRYMHKNFEQRIYEKLCGWGGLKAYLKELNVPQQEKLK